MRPNWTRHNASEECFIMRLAERLKALKTILMVTDEDAYREVAIIVRRYEEGERLRQRDIKNLGVFHCGQRLKYQRTRINCIATPRRENEKHRHFVATKYEAGEALYVATVLKIVRWMPTPEAKSSSHHFVMLVRTHPTAPIVINGARLDDLVHRTNVSAHTPGCADGEWVCVENRVSWKRPILVPVMRLDMPNMQRSDIHHVLFAPVGGEDMMMEDDNEDENDSDRETDGDDDH